MDDWRDIETAPRDGTFFIAARRRVMGHRELRTSAVPRGSGTGTIGGASAALGPEP